MAERSGRRDRSYGPVVLLGLASTTLTAVAGSRQWASSAGDAAGVPVEASVSGAEAAPLVTALALVALAAWGVVLVVRGPARRLVAAVGLVACVGSLSAVVVGFDSAQDGAREAVLARGATGDTFASSLSAWYFLAGAGALAAAATFAVALVRSPRWPAMGSRYDAPAARPTAGKDPVGGNEEQDMWRALDEGRDPTS